MRYLLILKDWNYGSVSDVKKLLKGNIYNCDNDEKANHLIAEGVAEEVSFGWIRDAEDKRDYTVNFSLLPGKKAVLPASWDLRSGFAAIGNQGNLGACTAFAGKGLVDFMEKKQGHTFLNGSELYLYYKTRVNIEHRPANQDTGCSIRGTIGSLVTYGICKEATWPYVVSKFAIAPTEAMVAEGKQYQALSYARLDATNSLPSTILTNVKTMVSGGYPVEFGFDVYRSFFNIGSNGLMPYPRAGEAYQGGHAVDVVGYNDAIRCPNTNAAGAFLVRNSWSSSWGLGGYFYMPYEIVTRAFNGRRMAADFWALGSVEWMNQGAK